MSGEQKVSAHKRRTRAEVQGLVAEFMISGMRRSEFCRSRQLSFGTLNRHLKKQRWKRKCRAASSAGRLGRLVRVELVNKKSASEHGPTSPLVVVLSGVRRIAVQRDFDVCAFERLVGILERA